MNSKDDKKLDIVYDHYKDTVAQISDSISLRDRLLIWLLVVATVMLLQIFSPKESGSLVAQFVSAKIGISAPIDPSFLGSVVWFVMLALSLKYFQTVGLIEKRYDYVHRVEAFIAKHYDGDHVIFSREGLHYLKDYPYFSNWSSLLYTIIFPVLLLIIIALKIWHECCDGDGGTLLYVNFAIFVSILISVALYMAMRHWKK